MTQYIPIMQESDQILAYTADRFVTDAINRTLDMLTNRLQDVIFRNHFLRIFAQYPFNKEELTQSQLQNARKSP